MKTLSCILAATDFSATGDRAVLRAALLAKQCGADLHLLHAVHPLDLYPGPGGDAAPPNAHAQSADGGRLAALSRLMGEHYGIRTHIAWRIGRSSTRIADYAQEVDAGLVVVGAQPDTSMMQFLVGSTACKLLRVHTGPLLIVRHPAAMPYQRILAALDFSPDSRAALTWARCTGPQARLDVVHVLESVLDGYIGRAFMTATAESATAAMAEILMGALLKDIGGDVTTHIIDGEPTEKILELADTRRAELIVLGQHGRGGLDEFLYGSVSTAVTQAADCDVLIIPSQER